MEPIVRSIPQNEQGGLAFDLLMQVKRAFIQGAR
jgi:hypothetical protein